MRQRFGAVLRRFPRGLRAIQAVRRWSLRAKDEVAFALTIAALTALRPFKVVRLARFRSEKIGHFISETDLALALLADASHPTSRPMQNVFIMPATACNEQVRLMYVRAFRALPGVTVLDCRSSHVGRILLGPAKTLTRRVQTGGRFGRFFCGSPTSEGIHHTSLRSDALPVLTFTKGEEAEGWRLLHNWGIKPTTPFVCFHVRDGAYLAATHPERSWAYHDYRNPDVESYVPMVQELLDRGYTVIRMGRLAERAFPLSHERFIDYPELAEQSDLLDVFVYAHARLGIAGSASGIDQFGYAFDAPSVVTDLVPFQPKMAVSQLVVTPCLLRSSATGELLPLSDMLRHQYFTSHEYESRGIEIVRNTAFEIQETVLEALSLGQPEGGEPHRDEALQSDFWEWAEHCGLSKGTRLGNQTSRYHTPRIGSAFLARHKAVLMA